MLAEGVAGKPLQANLRRAESSAYYALFHHLARASADLMVGGAGADKSRHAWKQIYRAIEHGVVEHACKQPIVKKFPKAIEDFANAFVSMQGKRKMADYDPDIKFTKSEVIADISVVQQAIVRFDTVSIKDRRAFCAYVLFKPPRK